jgi:hypothetical protein
VASPIVKVPDKTHAAKAIVEKTPAAAGKP